MDRAWKPIRLPSGTATCSPSLHFETNSRWKLISGWLLTMAVITCLVATLFILIAGGSRVFVERFSSNSEKMVDTYFVLSTRTVAIGSSAWPGRATSMPLAAFVILRGFRDLSASKYAPVTWRGTFSRWKLPSGQVKSSI